MPLPRMKELVPEDLPALLAVERDPLVPEDRTKKRKRRRWFHRIIKPDATKPLAPVTPPDPGDIKKRSQQQQHGDQDP
jgi:hypothetical protein